jgi:hypothetical protein
VKSGGRKLNNMDSWGYGAILHVAISFVICHSNFLSVEATELLSAPTSINIGTVASLSDVASAGVVVKTFMYYTLL